MDVAGDLPGEGDAMAGGDGDETSGDAGLGQDFGEMLVSVRMEPASRDAHAAGTDPYERLRVGGWDNADLDGEEHDHNDQENGEEQHRQGLTSQSKRPPTGGAARLSRYLDGDPSRILIPFSPC